MREVEKRGTDGREPWVVLCCMKEKVYMKVTGGVSTLPYPAPTLPHPLPASQFAIVPSLSLPRLYLLSPSPDSAISFPSQVFTISIPPQCLPYQDVVRWALRAYPACWQNLVVVTPLSLPIFYPSSPSTTPASSLSLPPPPSSVFLCIFFSLLSPVFVLPSPRPLYHPLSSPISPSPFLSQPLQPSP